MPRSREIVPAEALIEIAKDPHRFTKLLDEFSERQSVAVVAEATARDAVTVAEAAQQKAKHATETIGKREAVMTTRETDLRAANLEVEGRLAGAKVAEAALAKREDTVSERETALEGEREAAVEAVRTLLGGAK